ncbi:hypothetical protein C1280_20580 [Gemmata obscuriglobus]|uniref:Uncharacterized protein n=1 Tax=Gemmata obscuriglobus TaxID=114 RepID=A0A2Z3GZF3_9BACT|nr:hypothetical protein C1280_20580 [Gemmata obscuriglobus]
MFEGEEREFHGAFRLNAPTFELREERAGNGLAEHALDERRNLCLRRAGFEAVSQSNCDGDRTFGDRAITMLNRVHEGVDVERGDLPVCYRLARQVFGECLGVGRLIDQEMRLFEPLVQSVPTDDVLNQFSPAKFAKNANPFSRPASKPSRGSPLQVKVAYFLQNLEPVTRTRKDLVVAVDGLHQPVCRHRDRKGITNLAGLRCRHQQKCAGFRHNLRDLRREVGWGREERTPEVKRVRFEAKHRIEETERGLWIIVRECLPREPKLQSKRRSTDLVRRRLVGFLVTLTRLVRRVGVRVHL